MVEKLDVAYVAEELNPNKFTRFGEVFTIASAGAGLFVPCGSLDAERTEPRIILTLIGADGAAVQQQLVVPARDGRSLWAAYPNTSVAQLVGKKIRITVSGGSGWPQFLFAPVELLNTMPPGEPRRGRRASATTRTRRSEVKTARPP